MGVYIGRKYLCGRVSAGKDLSGYHSLRATHVHALFGRTGLPPLFYMFILRGLLIFALEKTSYPTFAYLNTIAANISTNDLSTRTRA